MKNAPALSSDALAALALLCGCLPAFAQEGAAFGEIDIDTLMLDKAETLAAVVNATTEATTAAATYTDERVTQATNAVTIAILDTDSRLQVTNDIFRVQTRTAGGAWSNVWDSAEATASRDTVSRIAAVETSVETLGRRVDGAVSAWADYDAQGHANPDPDTIALNRAFTTIGSGFYWATSGAYAVLASSGSVAYVADVAGSFRIFGNSVSNYFGLVAGGTVTVGAIAQGIHYDGATESVTITYPGSADNVPVIYGAPTLSGPWTMLENAVIVDEGRGTVDLTYPATAQSFFFKGTTTAELSEYFHATVPAYLEGGVMTGANDVDPVVYDSTITITSGGRTYRLPAQLVQ